MSERSQHPLVRGVAALLALALVTGVAGTSRADEVRPPVVDPEQDAWKQAHVARVSAELATRPTEHLAPEAQAARRALVEALKAYGERGVFAQDPDHPGLAISHLIDPHGTRCALAHLIDVSGDSALLGRLAAANNEAFVPELLEDAGFRAWLAKNGLEADEAAWIQAPGFVDPTPDGSTPSDGPVTDGRGGPTTVSGGARSGPTRRGGATETAWPTWWGLHRDEWMDLRARYHAAIAATGEGAERGLRPSDEQVRSDVLPLLRRLATEKDGPVRPTALMAWARVARGAEAEAAIEATLDYLAHEHGVWREVMVLALGVPRHEAALEPLIGLATDSAVGRRLLKRSDVPSRVQAFAALALGQLGRPEAVEPLLALLERTSSDDLRCACWLGLGGSVRDTRDVARATVVRRAVERLRTKGLDDGEAAAVPAALALAGDTTALPALEEVLARFRKPEAARPACVLAITRLAPRLAPGLADTLIATARRDPDPDARRFALVALGELAERTARCPEASSEDLAMIGAKSARFWRGAFDGLNVAQHEQGWAALGAARFARAWPEHAVTIAKDLRSLAGDRGNKERQSAAALALAVLEDTDSLQRLRADFQDAKDVELRSWLALVLGALGAHEERGHLLELAREDGNDAVRYRAALGLGYAADSTAVPQLVQALQATKSQPVQTALARVLGELGDRRALPALLEVAGDAKADDWTRHRAIGAIALIAQPEDRAWVRTFQPLLDPTRATPTVRALLSLY
ncbi:MAG: HEAT repeat domain-containing protein [Planctomycetota bacterium]